MSILPRPAASVKPVRRPRTHSSPIPRPPLSLTCVHRGRGLCPSCRADYREDPEAYVEFGNHPAGIERYRALLEDLVQAGAISPDEDASDVPF